MAIVCVWSAAGLIVSALLFVTAFARKIANALALAGSHRAQLVEA